MPFSFYSSKDISLFLQKMSSSITVFNFDNKKVSWAPKQHIKMISEGSCDTEDWSNDFWRFIFASQE